jgi:hypothetical protein
MGTVRRTNRDLAARSLPWPVWFLKHKIDALKAKPWHAQFFGRNRVSAQILGIFACPSEFGSTQPKKLSKIASPSIQKT